MKHKHTALVTGGSRGIGKAIAKQLAKDGYYVLINYSRDKAGAENTLSEITNEGGAGELLPFDVSNAEQVQEVLEKWTSDNNQVIDILVNNAGITKDNLMVFMTDEEWSKVIDINQSGFFYVTRTLLQSMIVNKFGRIINVVSLSGQKGLPGQVNYSASKGAVIAATKSLAMEVAKKKITVNCVAPGFISSDMTADLDEKSLKKLVPMNRFGTAEEVAYAVSFLASDKASYITGETISINGGMYS